MSTLRIAAFVAATSVAAFAEPLATLATTGSLPPATPVYVVPPGPLEKSFVNETVKVRFLLDKEGHPHEVAPASPMPEELADRVVAAVSKWRFTPCRDASGNPVQRTVVLPITLSDRS